MATAFRRDGEEFTARIEPEEMEILTELLRMTADFVAPTDSAPTGSGDADASGPDAPDLNASRPGEISDDFLERALGLGNDPNPQEPTDPALRRLLPSAHREDEEQAAEFRRLTEHGLRGRKADNLRAALAALRAAEPPEIRLDAEAMQALAVGLTDVRLVLAERLELHTGEDAERLHTEFEAAMERQESADPQAGDDHGVSPAVQQMAYYEFLTWLQESVTSSLLD